MWSEDFQNYIFFYLLIAFWSNWQFVPSTHVFSAFLKTILTCMWSLLFILFIYHILSLMKRILRISRQVLFDMILSFSYLVLADFYVFFYFVIDFKQNCLQAEEIASSQNACLSSMDWRYTWVKVVITSLYSCFMFATAWIHVLSIRESLKVFLKNKWIRIRNCSYMRFRLLCFF